MQKQTRNHDQHFTLNSFILLEQTITLDMFSFVIIIHGLFIIYILGASSSYCTVSAQILMTRKLQQKLPYLAKFKSGLNNWWKVCCYRKLWFRYILFNFSSPNSKGHVSSCMHFSSILLHYVNAISLRSLVQ